MELFSKVFNPLKWKRKSQQVIPTQVKNHTSPASPLPTSPVCSHCSEFDPFNSQAANPICLKCKGDPSRLSSA